MIRATSTDGDALSVKEAIYLHKKVIATNCVDRPSGVSLFEYDNPDSLKRAILDTSKPSHTDITNGILSLKKLYEEVAAK